MSILQPYLGIFSNWDFQPAMISSVLDRLLKKKLVETETKRPISGSVEHWDSSYRITSVGSYYYQKLVRIFTYVDAMVVDTPIVDRNVREKIVDENSILGRLERAEEFRQYLDSQWERIKSAG